MKEEITNHWLEPALLGTAVGGVVGNLITKGKFGFNPRSALSGAISAPTIHNISRLIHHEKKASKFNPDFTPEQLKEKGVIDSVYNRTKPRLASLDKWPDKWLHKDDPKGWLEWYEKYSKGRKHEDDDRQIRRWKNFKARHGGNAFKENPTPRRAFALTNWAIDPTKFVTNKSELIKSMNEYKMKKESTDSKHPGLWANIKAKRARGQKPAKPGQQGYPDAKNWNKLTKSSNYEIYKLIKSAVIFRAPPMRIPRFNLAAPLPPYHARGEEALNLLQRPPSLPMQSSIPTEQWHAPFESVDDVLGRHALNDFQEANQIQPQTLFQRLLADRLRKNNDFKTQQRRKQYLQQIS